MVKVHYFYDPMCGWCYGATSLVEVLAAHPDIDITMHAGGMIERRPMNDSFKAMAREHDAHIAAMTGQVFSQAYKARLGSEQSIILDSLVTSQAVATMQQRYGLGIDMLKAVQHAHFYLALDVSVQKVLTEIANQLLPTSQYIELFSNAVDIKQHITQSHDLMNQWMVQGFPTFIIEHQGLEHRIEHNRYYNNTTMRQAHLDQIIHQIHERNVDAQIYNDID